MKLLEGSHLKQFNPKFIEISAKNFKNDTSSLFSVIAEYPL